MAYSALGGGILIGISATLPLLFNCRIAGICGMMSGLFNATYRELFSRGFFLIGIMIRAFLCYKLMLRTHRHKSVSFWNGKRKKHKANHFALRTKLFIKANQMAYRELQPLRSA